MTDFKAISFVVPVHNEAGSLRLLHSSIVEICRIEQYDFEIIYIDDGSSDDSYKVISELAEKDPHTKVIQFRRNFGQAAAMSAGIHASRAPLIVTLDADLQNDPQDVPSLLEKLKEGYDVVSGIRAKRKDGISKRWPSKLANKIISMVTGVKLKDYGCSLKIYKREFLENVTLYGDMHRFIPIFAAWNGARVSEIPVHHHARKQGKSHYGFFGRTGRVLLDLLTVKFLHSFISRPMHFFGAAGSWLMATGLLCGIIAVVLKLTHIRDFVATPLPLLTIFLITTGIIALLMGLLGELLIRIYFEQKGNAPYRIKGTLNISEK